MRNAKFILPMLLIFAAIGNVWGADVTTVFNITSYGSIPTGWSQSGASTGTYFKLDANGYMMSPECSAHTSYNLTFKNAKFGSGTNPKLTVQILKASDNSVLATYYSQVPTSSSYLTTTIVIGDMSQAFKIKILNPSGNAAARLQAIKLTYEETGSTYTLYLYDADNGTVGVSGKTGTAESYGKSYSGLSENDKLTLTNTPASGYRFDGWTVMDEDSKDLSSCLSDDQITMPAQDVYVYPNFSSACSRSITISKGSETNGTFTLGTTGSVCIDGGNASTTVTCFPNAHYHVSNVTSTGGGSVTGSENSWTVSDISVNTKINVTFEEDTKYTVIFKNAGSQVDTREVYANEAIGTLPEKGTMESCDDTSTTFMGWTTATISEKTSTEPTYITAETVVDNDNFVVNAVWAREE